MRPDRLAAIADFQDRLTDLVDQAKLTVFVCGPATADANGGPSVEPGAAVRRYVSERIVAEGHRSVWGEHLQSKNGMPDDPRIRRFDDADKEIMFAVDQGTDLIVIFPSSSGSLAELGAFSMHDKISFKLLIVFDKRYKGDTGFVVKALGRAARSRKASIHFKDYSRPKSVWEVVRKQLHAQRMLKAVRMTHD